MADKFTMNSPARRKAKNNYDPNSVITNTYNDAAGAKKISDVGHHLVAIDGITDLSTVKRVGPGVILALFNSDTVVQTVNVGDSISLTSLAIGVVSGESVGIALLPGQYTYINTYTHAWAITSSNKVICYKVLDDTFMNTRV